MTYVRLLQGNLLIVKDPDTTMHKGQHLPDIRKVRAMTGKVLMHEQGWLEDMKGKLIVYAKFSEKPFPLGEAPLFTITEDSVMAVLDEE